MAAILIPHNEQEQVNTARSCAHDREALPDRRDPRQKESHAFKENQQSSTEPSGRPIQKASFDALQPNDWVEIEKLQEAANREDEAV
jgi:hypothetical protein